MIAESACKDAAQTQTREIADLSVVWYVKPPAQIQCKSMFVPVRLYFALETLAFVEHGDGDCCGHGGAGLPGVLLGISLSTSLSLGIEKAQLAESLTKLS